MQGSNVNNDVQRVGNTSDIREWIVGVLGPSEVNLDEGVDFPNSLKSGELLCHLISKLYPGCISDLSAIECPSPEIRIQSYLKACSDIGMHPTDTFLPEDIVLESNLPLVFKNLRALAEMHKGSTVTQETPGTPLQSNSPSSVESKDELAPTFPDEISPEHNELVAWANLYLSKANPPCTLENLSTDIRSGLKLLRLLEVLTKEPLASVYQLSEEPTLWERQQASELALSLIEQHTLSKVECCSAVDIISGNSQNVAKLFSLLRDKYDLDYLYFKVLNERSQPSDSSDTEVDLTQAEEDPLGSEQQLPLKTRPRSRTIGGRMSLELHGIKNGFLASSLRDSADGSREDSSEGLRLSSSSFDDFDMDLEIARLEMMQEDSPQLENMKVPKCKNLDLLFDLEPIPSLPSGSTFSGILDHLNQICKIDLSSGEAEANQSEDVRNEIIRVVTEETKKVMAHTRKLAEEHVESCTKKILEDICSNKCESVSYGNLDQTAPLPSFEKLKQEIDSIEREVAETEMTLKKISEEKARKKLAKEDKQVQNIKSIKHVRQPSRSGITVSGRASHRRTESAVKTPLYAHKLQLRQRQHQSPTATRTSRSLSVSEDDQAEIAQAAVRKCVVSELLDTERSYLRHLQTVSAFIANVRHKNVLGDEEIRSVFSNWEQLAGVHEVLVGELTKKYDSWCPNTTIGDIFLTNGKEFLKYESYLHNYAAATVSLHYLRQRDPKFASLIQQFHQQQTETHFELQAFLIMPVQRLPRYLLLLENMQKYTSPMHPDRQMLIDAHKYVLETVNLLNSGIDPSLAIRARKLVSVASSIATDDPTPLVIPNRTLVREGAIEVKLQWTPSLDKSIPAPPRIPKHKSTPYIFLFNDLLLYCDQMKAPKDGKLFTLLELIRIDQIKNVVCTATSVHISLGAVSQANTWILTPQKSKSPTSNLSLWETDIKSLVTKSQQSATHTVTTLVIPPNTP
ncbi:RhoGEF domain [Pelomyxa schiedti]|nr:RhoGEF domain [Pelomyxa schiedti]